MGDAKIELPDVPFAVMFSLIGMHVPLAMRLIRSFVRVAATCRESARTVESQRYSPRHNQHEKGPSGWRAVPETEGISEYYFGSGGVLPPFPTPAEFTILPSFLRLTRKAKITGLPGIKLVHPE
jgi:hypothetical protein